MRASWTELPEPALAAFSPEQLAFARDAWPMRAAEELRSALIYRALAASSRGVLPEPWPARFAATAREEIGHARLCAEVGARLGASAPRYDGTPVRTRLAALPDPVARTAALVLAEIAIGETISMALFRAGRRTTREPLVRTALEAICADEVRHQRLGWDALAALVPRLPPWHREQLATQAAHAFAASEAQIAAPVLRRLAAGERFDPAWGELGVLPFETRVDAYYFAVERFAIPRLEKLGIAAERAWRERYSRS
ncbi:MAG TPA: ferritin-like domain-containing protein [Kofleriaceae bacterium]|jgi:hypothetical protein